MTEDLNRKLALLIEPMPQWADEFATKSLGRVWLRPPLTRLLVGEGHHKRETPPYPRAFDTDETASAMLLEMMPAPELYKHPADCGEVGSDVLWRCRPDWGLDANATAGDRKLAVRAAAIAYFEQLKAAR